MGITSRRMEGAARHMELPSTTAILSNCSYKYEYMFAFSAAMARWERPFWKACSEEWLNGPFLC